MNIATYVSRMLEQVARAKEGEHEEGRGLLTGPGQGVRVKHGGPGTGQERPNSALRGALILPGGRSAPLPVDTVQQSGGGYACRMEPGL